MNTLYKLFKRTCMRGFLMIGCIFSWPQRLGEILLEGLRDDATGAVSSGRIGLMASLSFSMIVTLLGMWLFVKYDKQPILDYSQFIALQFLGTAVLFYGTIKGAGALTTKFSSVKDIVSKFSKKSPNKDEKE